MRLNKDLVPTANSIQNIIFDWGGIFTNIDYNQAIDAFKELGLEDFGGLYTQLNQVELFDHLEKGTITPAVFRKEMRRHLRANVTDQQIDTAWTSLLMDTDPKKVAVAKSASNNYRTFLLSNTNAIHVGIVRERIEKEIGFDMFTNTFEKIYLSHELHMRKPDAEIFEFVLANAQLAATETLFIDDTPQHIEGAKAVGLHTFHLTTEYKIWDLFN